MALTRNAGSFWNTPITKVPRPPEPITPSVTWSDGGTACAAIELVDVADGAHAQRRVLLEHAHHEGAAAPRANHPERDLVRRGNRVRGNRARSGEQERAAGNGHRVIISP